jgi:glycogen operon protein
VSTGIVTASLSAPLGATVHDTGVNFSVFARDAAHVELLLFDEANAPRPAQTIDLDPASHRTHGYWHVFVPGLRPGQLYAYRAHGRSDPQRGLRFDGGKVLLDPYARGVVIPERYNRGTASVPGDNAACAMKNVVADTGRYDWSGDAPLSRPFSETVIYQLHVRAFTGHASSGVDAARRGTYAGLIDKIPYLQDLGITAVELLPVFQFDPLEAPAGRVSSGIRHPISFFAPHHAYSSRLTALGALDEFRDMVKALHRAGLEIILDVAFDHTAEGGDDGPTLCYRGLANDVYYLAQDRSGDGGRADSSILNVNHPIVRRLIEDSLRFWVTEMHVDGFRFDLASILWREGPRRPLAHPPVLWDIESDRVLAHTKLIADGADAASLYHAGSFAGDTWHEWNGSFRDDVRRFVRGDDHTVSPLATRLLGSPDLYGRGERAPERSVNFVTCHDGFTMNDLVSYSRLPHNGHRLRHREGLDDGLSWNCGAEGPTGDAGIEALRNRQIKNFFAIELLAVGTPMLLMGDEVRRTQHGHDNGYGQDDETSWFDWRLLERHGDVLRFVSMLNAFRRSRDAALGRSLTLNQLIGCAQISWHGVRLDHPDWSAHSHVLAFTLRSRRARFLFHAMFNAYWQPLAFQLPPLRPRSAAAWQRWIDTALPSPEDIRPWREAPVIAERSYVVQPRSVALLALEIQHRDRIASESA